MEAEGFGTDQLIFNWGRGEGGVSTIFLSFRLFFVVEPVQEILFEISDCLARYFFVQKISLFFFSNYQCHIPHRMRNI